MPSTELLFFKDDDGSVPFLERFEGLQGMNYRMLYFFHGREAVVVSHGLVKERIVPVKQIELAIRRKEKFAADPEKHSYQEEK
jgi:hypothetical protein